MTSVKVELPAGSSIGLEFAGSPPVLKSVDAGHSGASLTKDDNKSLPLNWYAQTVIMGDTEYSYIADTASLNEILKSFSHLSRTLVLYKTPLVGPPQVTLTLPAGDDTGIVLNGFPPVVVSVDPQSVWHGKVPEGYVVDRFILPESQQELSLDSGGFTATNVNRALVESAQQEGRQMVLKKVKPKGDVTSSSRPFDLGSFANQSRWTIKRMFGREQKASPVKKGDAKSLA